ncbi:hypothetical protein V5P93_002603 [Actinokineospora auranticolor]|uniref:Uncharacterized protein n=1 Tax=Actinokineospora auranticolor TaxID=155976 RepID=A0A2S6GMA8_9PSEU|nr:hypothetical protein [Actinokineospora auranticolor]PPK66368.1 hypothetical protein CLV40_11072 [Actinokineospora auranticolor]
MSENTLVTIGRFITHCLLPNGYHFPEEFGKAINLTPTGSEIIGQIAGEHPDFLDSDLKAAALGRFTARNSLLIDCDRSGAAAALESISVEVAEKRIRYPWILGQGLDQRYAKLYSTDLIQESLPPIQSYQLLDPLPQGVFQLRNLVCGPFGLQESASARYFAPLTCGPTYLCPRVECTTGHHVGLRTGDTDAGQAWQIIERRYPTGGVLSNHVIDILRPDDDYYDVFNADNLPWLVGNGLTPDEQRTLVQTLIRKDRLMITDRLSGAHGMPTNKNAVIKMITSYDDARCLQLTLLYPTTDIVEAIEELVDDDAIHLTPTELRKAVAVRHKAGGSFHVEQELSRNGIRFTGNTQPLNLRTFLQSIYATEEQREELGYLLREYQSGTPYDKLDYFLRDADENELLSRLVLSTRGSLMRSFKELRYGRFEVPAGPEDEQRLRGRLLWKLGRTQEPPPSNDQAVLRHIDRIREVENVEYAAGTEWATVARSAGLDLFVEAESFLASATEFACWLLTNDHCGRKEELFVYSRAKSRAWSASVLSQESDNFTYDPAGRNSLGVLIESLLRVAQVAERTVENADMYVKQSDGPTYSKYTQLRIYPFNHSRMVCDLTRQSQSTLIDALREAHSTLVRAKVAEVRNRLGHAPSTFPTLTDLIRAAEGVSAAATTLTSAGLTPTVFGFESSLRTASGRTKKTYRDGSNREAHLYLPSPLTGTGIPDGDHQMIICGSAIVANTTEPLRFLVEEDTVFADYWRGYRDRDTSGPAAHSTGAR